MDYDNEIERLSVMDDLFRASLALCQIANNKTVATQLKKLRRVLRQVADAEAKVIAAEEHAAEIVAKAESDVKAIHEAAAQRLASAEAAEQDLRERERRIQILEAAWRYIGEPQDVLSGFRSPELSPLAKARRAYGLPPGKDPDPLLFSEPDAAPAMRIDALSDTSDDPHADRQGAAFLGELTRDVSHKRRGAT
jgi:hypothetical protein